MAASLGESLSRLSDSVSECVRAGRQVSVTTHNDCDGLTSGSIITKALARAGARCSVSAVREFGPAEAAALREGPFHVITDLGGGSAGALDGRLGDGWAVIDHHQIEGDELDCERVVNAWRFGMDGGADVCAGGMAYLAARAIGDANADLSAVAVVAALGDRQDGGEKRSLTGKNLEIAKDAEEAGLVETGLDLLLVGRETRPLPDALAFTSRPFIEGLTWNRDACLAMLTSAGVALKDGARWRAAAELDDEERRAVIEAIARYAPGGGATEAMEELVGYTYTLPREERGGLLRDGREFSTMLNSCGRIGRAGVGMAVCMGDRGRMLSEAEGLLREYRSRIRGYMSVLAGERWRVAAGPACVMVNGEGVVPESMAGTVSSLLAGSPAHAGKVVILRAAGDGGTVKFSSRKAPGCSSPVNLSALMREGAARFGGVGGGHDGAAGARVAKDKLGGFLDYLEANVAGVQGQGGAEGGDGGEGGGGAQGPGA